MSEKYVLFVEDDMESNHAIRKTIKALKATILCPYTVEPQIAFGADSHMVLSRAQALFDKHFDNIYAVVLDLAWTSAEVSYFDDLILDSEQPHRSREHNSGRGVPLVFELIKYIERKKSLIPIIILSRYGDDVFKRVYGSKALYTYISKSNHHDIPKDLKGPLDNAINFSGLVKAHDHVFVPPTARYIKLLNTLPKLASSSNPIFIEGATGTGKELWARMIHTLRNADKPFYHVSFGARRGGFDLLRSELFGHRKGMFTGALEDKKGVLVRAHEKGGTVFLDEVGKASDDAQVLLLKLIQNKAVEVLGEEEDVTVKNASLIFAASENLAELEARDEFMEDLRHRLRVHVISLPTLKEVRDSGVDLVDYIKWSEFTERKAAAGDRDKIVEAKPTSDDRAALEDFDFPGNFRQLHNVLKRAKKEEISIRESISVEREYEDRKKAEMERLRKPGSAVASSIDLDFIANRLAEMIRAGKRGAGGEWFDKKLKQLVVRRMVDGTSKSKDEAAERLGISTGTLNRILREE